jgi:hypothetical protein
LLQTIQLSIAYRGAKFHNIRWTDPPQRCADAEHDRINALKLSSSRFWDNEIVPLICPTCQAYFGLTEDAHAGNHLATVHGVVFDVLGGSRDARRHSDGAWALQAVAQIVGFGLESLKMHYLSMGID